MITAATRILASLAALALAIASVSNEPLREFAATGAFVGLSGTALAALAALALRRSLR